jgi:hypothetical protein
MEAHYTNNGSIIPHKSQAPSSLVFLMSIEFLTVVWQPAMADAARWERMASD